MVGEGPPAVWSGAWGAEFKVAEEAGPAPCSGLRGSFSGDADAAEMSARRPPWSAGGGVCGSCLRVSCGAQGADQTGRLLKQAPLDSGGRFPSSETRSPRHSEPRARPPRAPGPEAEVCSFLSFIRPLTWPRATSASGRSCWDGGPPAPPPEASPSPPVPGERPARGGLAQSPFSDHVSASPPGPSNVSYE